MAMTTAVQSNFRPLPPLDYPLRLAFEFGRFGFPRMADNPIAHDPCCSDHFESITPDGSSGLHQIHEAIDLASGEGAGGLFETNLFGSPEDDLTAGNSRKKDQARACVYGENCGLLVACR